MSSVRIFNFIYFKSEFHKVQYIPMVLSYYETARLESFISFINTGELTILCEIENYRLGVTYLN